MQPGHEVLRLYEATFENTADSTGQGSLQENRGAENISIGEATGRRAILKVRTANLVSRMSEATAPRTRWSESPTARESSPPDAYQVRTPWRLRSLSRSSAPQRCVIALRRCSRSCPRDPGRTPSPAVGVGLATERSIQRWQPDLDPDALADHALILEAREDGLIVGQRHAADNVRVARSIEDVSASITRRFSRHHLLQPLARAR